MVVAHKMRQAQVSQISTGTCSYALTCALDWLLQPVLLILQPHRITVTFPPTFSSPCRNNFVQIHGGTTLLKAKFGTTPQNRPNGDLNLGVGWSYGTNKPSLPNPSFQNQFIRSFVLTLFSSFVLTLFIFKAPNYVLARTLTERVV